MFYDLAIVGGGPAGLSAAINGASEGLKVCLLDASAKLGGQARESNRIENYPMPLGFDEGVTGENLLGGFINQAYRFDTHIINPLRVHRLECEKGANVLLTEDFQEIKAQAVILANGLTYRRHGAKGLASFLGNGCYYGMPPNLPGLAGKTVVVVGGANSAGQAALAIAGVKRTTVKLVSRSPLVKAMSTYLIDRLAAAPNVEVIEGVDVSRVSGNGRLREVFVAAPEGEERGIEADCLMFYIGAMPQTYWLKGTIELDDKNFICTGSDVSADGARLPYETSQPGVFAIGDVRKGSTKRIANCVGEGGAGLQMVHAFRKLH